MVFGHVPTTVGEDRPEPPESGARPERGPRPDPSALVAALASGLGLERSAVTTALDKLHAAHEAGHEERHIAMFAAIARELGLTTEAVQTAFESVLPERPDRHRG